MDTQNTNPLADLFQITTTKEKPVVTFSAQDKVDNLSEIKNTDLKYTRDNIMNLIEVGQMTLMNLSRFLEQAQSPKAYDSFSTLLKTLLDANKELVEIHKKNDEMNKPKNIPEDTKKNINNNLIVSSTSDIAKLLEDRIKGENNE